MQKYTKIVATVSDKRCSVEFIKSLFDAGVNVVRMNSAHLDYEGFKKLWKTPAQPTSQSQ